MKVKDCCTGDVCCVNTNTKLNEIAKIMSDNHVGCIPVCDDNNCMVGVITDRDIVLRSIANNKDVNTTPASEIMTTNVCTCSQNDEIEEAERKMSKYQIRRIPVLENGKVIGILTMGDLAQFDEEIGRGEVCTTIENICDCNVQAKNNC